MGTATTRTGRPTPPGCGAGVVGALLVAPRSPTEPLSAADRKLLDALARQVGAAVHALALALDLVESRARPPPPPAPPGRGRAGRGGRGGGAAPPAGPPAGGPAGSSPGRPPPLAGTFGG